MTTQKDNSPQVNALPTRSVTRNELALFAIGIMHIVRFAAPTHFGTESMCTPKTSEKQALRGQLVYPGERFDVP